MAIDLIPVDYRQRRDLLKLLQRIGMLLCVIFTVLILARAAIWGLFANQQQQHDQLMAGEKAREQQYAQIQMLEQRRNQLKNALDKRTEMLLAPSISSLLQGLDNAFSGEIWLTDLIYSRGMGDRKNGPSGAPIMPAPSNSVAGSKSQGGQLELRGAARQYPAVYDFVDRFAQQPGTLQIQVIETSRNGKSADGLVTFVAEAQLANTTTKKSP